MRKSWPLVALGEVLKKSEESVSIDPNTMYREVTIKLWGKGVVGGQ
jgi:type I restriction enzyme S subunit